MRSTPLPFSPPSIGTEEIAEVVDTLRSVWITTGPKVKRFEQEFAAFSGASTALALNSCTAALHIALEVLGIGPGDEVITTPMTFAASVNVIEHVGASPVLVDVEPDTLNLDPARVAEALDGGNGARHRGTSSGGNGRVRALLPVHLYGHPCDMDALTDLARTYDLATIEDAAHALPAKYKGKLVGAPSPTGAARSAVCFSFYATKNMTTAEGGMLTGSPGMVDEARPWSLHGMSRDAWKRYSCDGSWYYEVDRPGFKYNMTDVQAAIGLPQLRKLPQFYARRRQIVHQYNEVFSRLDELQTPIERPEVEHAWHLYVLRLNLQTLTIDRARVIAELTARHIGTSVHFIPIHLHSYYRQKYGYQPGDFPVAHREYERIVSLPLYPGMSDEDVQDVIEAVCDVAKRFRR